MQKILRLTLVFLFVSLFVASPIVFYFYQNNKTQKDSNVKGASTSLPNENGLYINVISKNGNWDLYKYLCKDYDDCISDLNSGEYWGIVSGGDTSGYLYNIDSYTNIDPEYKYLKIFVKSSWGSLLRIFEPSIISNYENINSVSILNEMQEYSAVIIPVEVISADSSNIIQFSD